MSERSQYPELSFLNGGVRFNFNSSRWSKIPTFPVDIDQLNCNLPAVILRNSIFTLVPSYSFDGFMVIII